MKFITDGMLGKLTRWLRMLGHDVEYAGSLEDDKLIKASKNEHRILLTRDLELYRRAVAHGVEALFIESLNEAEKLAKLAKRFGFKLEINPSVSRCPKCNTRIKPIPKEEVMDKVPKSTFTFYDEFWICPNCGKVYWQGAHWRRIKKTLEEARRIVDKEP